MPGLGSATIPGYYQAEPGNVSAEEIKTICDFFKMNYTERTDRMEPLYLRHYKTCDTVHQRQRNLLLQQNVSKVAEEVGVVCYKPFFQLSTAGLFDEHSGII